MRYHQQPFATYCCHYYCSKWEGTTKQKTIWARYQISNREQLLVRNMGKLLTFSIQHISRLLLGFSDALYAHWCAICHVDVPCVYGVWHDETLRLVEFCIWNKRLSSIHHIDIIFSIFSHLFRHHIFVYISQNECMNVEKLGACSLRPKTHYTSTSKRISFSQRCSRMFQRIRIENEKEKTLEQLSVSNPFVSNPFILIYLIFVQHGNLILAHAHSVSSSFLYIPLHIPFFSLLFLFIFHSHPISQKLLILLPLIEQRWRTSSE